MRLFTLLLGLLLYPLIAQGQQRDLDFFIQQALRNSPLLKDLENQQASNRIDSLRLLASLHTQVNGNVAAVLAPNLNGWGYDEAITNGGLFTALVSVNQPIVGHANVANQTQSIALQTQAAQINAKTSGQDIRRSVTAQYLIVWGDHQQLQINQELLDLLHREEAVLKHLTETNVYRQTDYLTFLTTMQQQDLSVLQWKNQERTDLYALQYLCGSTDTSFYTLREPVLSPLVIPNPESSAFYATYRLDSLRIRNSDARIDFAYRPKVSIAADAGYNSSFLSRGYRNFGISAGVLLTVPLYDGHQQQMQHDQNSIAEKTRQEYARYFSQQYRQQIAQLYQQLAQTDALIAQITDQIKYSRTLLEAHGKLLRTGDARMADYILALNNYKTAQNLATQQYITRLQIINQLNYWSLK